MTSLLISSDSTAYINGDTSSVTLHTRQRFQSRFDKDDPDRAMSEYARLMYQHTQRQMEMACRSARRRSPEEDSLNGAGSFGSNLSHTSSLESMQSRRS